MLVLQCAMCEQWHNHLCTPSADLCFISLSPSLSTRVLVALDCSQLVLTQTLVLQQHLRTLLEQQLSHVRAFNLLR